MSTTTKMLRDLLERVEAGELLITDFDVSNDVEEGKLTGEVRYYVTTVAGPRKPAASWMFNSSARTFEDVAESWRKAGEAMDKAYGPAKGWPKPPQDSSAVSHTLSERSRCAVAPVQELMHSVYQFMNDCDNGRVSKRERAETRENYLARIKSVMGDYPPQSLRHAWLSATLAHLAAFNEAQSVPEADE